MQSVSATLSTSMTASASASGYVRRPHRVNPELRRLAHFSTVTEAISLEKGAPALALDDDDQELPYALTTARH